MKFAVGDMRFDSTRCTLREITDLTGAVALFFRKRGTGRIYLGFDTRLTTPFMKDALTRALTGNGIDVMMPHHPISSCLFYWNCLEEGIPGIMITASHNPGQWNGLKMVESDLRPISSEAIGALMAASPAPWSGKEGTITYSDRQQQYIDEMIRMSGLSPETEADILVDFLSGVNGPDIMSALSRFSGIKADFLHEEMDGNFPQGAPNPLSETSIREFREKLAEKRYGLGFVFDGDGDRTGVFAEDGIKNESYALLPLIAGFIKKDPKLLSDAKTPLPLLRSGMGLCRTGHVHIKRMMRDHRAEGYTAAAEGSGHFFYSIERNGNKVVLESSLLTMLLTIRAYTEKRDGYEAMRKEMVTYTTLPEITKEFADPEEKMNEVKEHFRALGAELYEEDAAGEALWSLIMKMDGYQIYQHASETERGLVRWQIIEYRKDAAKAALRYLQCFS